MRILNVLGLRADESRDRAKQPAYRPVTVNRDRHVDEVAAGPHLEPPGRPRLVRPGRGSPTTGPTTRRPARPTGTALPGARAACASSPTSGASSSVWPAGPRLAALYAHVEEVRREPFRRDWSMRHLIDLAQAPAHPHRESSWPTTALEFEALDRAVRAALLVPARSIRVGKDAAPRPDR
ncbi:hypothetical protein ACU686_26725 [Yinghuangia aomiensis]